MYPHVLEIYKAPRGSPPSGSEWNGEKILNIFHSILDVLFMTAQTYSSHPNPKIETTRTTSVSESK